MLYDRNTYLLSFLETPHRQTELLKLWHCADFRFKYGEEEVPTNLRLRIELSRLEYRSRSYSREYREQNSFTGRPTQLGIN